MRPLILLLFLSLMFSVVGSSAQMTKASVEPSAALTSTSGNADGDDFAPALFVGVLIAAAILCTIVVGYIVLSILALLLVLGLIAWGIISLSVVTGVVQKSFVKGFRLFMILSGVAAGSLSGSILLFVANSLFLHRLTGIQTIVIGSIVGSIGGVVVALIIFNALHLLARYLSEKLNTKST